MRNCRWKLTLQHVHFSPYRLVNDGRQCKQLMNNIVISEHTVTTKLHKPPKQTRLGYHLPDITLRAFEHDHSFWEVLLTYSYQTASLKRDNCRFMSWPKLYKSVSAETISRWIKTVLNDASIDMEVLTPHSVRSPEQEQVTRMMSSSTPQDGQILKCTARFIMNQLYHELMSVRRCCSKYRHDNNPCI